MKPPRIPAPAAAAKDLRRRAEATMRVRRRPRLAPKAGPAADATSRRMLHELQVHQVELEMQNAELLESRNRTESLLEKYTSLYDFAPIGYFSLDPHGRILELNLTGSALLGVERSLLLHQRLVRHLVAPGRRLFLAFLQDVFSGKGNPSCEALLRRADGTTLWASFHGVRARTASGREKECRVSVSDISTHKKAEEEHQRLNSLTVANERLSAEIVRRRAVEKALRASERNHGRLLKQAKLLHAQLRHLSHQILETQEEERKRISRELHDEISQTLVGIHVYLEKLAQEDIGRPDRFRRSILRTQRLVEKSVRVVHDFARGLRPPLLDDLGLIPTLHSYVKDFSQQTGIRVHFTAFAGVDPLNNARRTAIYRVAQAALANVAQHAHATHVRLSLSRHPTSIVMEVADDGIAFEVEKVLHARTNKRLGLIGMRERMEMMGGTFAVESTPGQGTTIRAQVPITPRSS